MAYFIEGSKALIGTVNISGSKESALTLIAASMFSNEDIVLENVPDISLVHFNLEILEKLGAKVLWMGNNRVLLNGSQINTYEIPEDLGKNCRNCILLAGPLLFRFGKAVIPKFEPEEDEALRINRIIEMWELLRIKVEESEDSLYLESVEIKPAAINFKKASKLATQSAVLSSVFISGETAINNSSEASEIDDLINFLNIIGAEIKRTGPKEILITGSNIFKQGSFSVQPETTEAVLFAAAALLTNGNIVIKNTLKEPLIPFVNFLNKIGANFEFTLNNELKVWRNHEPLSNTDLTISPSPGFIPEWQTFASLILTQSEGVSRIHDTVYIDRFDYIRDLNMMGADLKLFTPSELGIPVKVSDDSYDLEKEGEPQSVLEITGGTNLKGTRIAFYSNRYAPVMLLAALSAEGKSEVTGIEYLTAYYENIINKFIDIGAKIWEQ